MTDLEHSYRGRHAALYDLFYASKSYSQEAEFVHQCITRHGDGGPSKRLLELACGTGNHAIPFARLGFIVTASDNSPEMLAEAARKVVQEEAKIAFLELDMRDMSALSGSYDVIICLFDSIGYVQTDAALDAVITGVRAHLRNGGLFIFEFWHAPPMLKEHDPVRVRRFSVDGGKVLRISETTLKPEVSMAEVIYSIFELHDDGTYNETIETQTNRFFTLTEMKARARSHNFSDPAYYAGFQSEVEISNETWHVLAVWKKE